MQWPVEHGCVRSVIADGVDPALELVGTPTLPDTLRATRVHGVVCFTAYGGDAADLPPAVLQQFLDDVAVGRARVPIHKVYRLDQIAEAHADMEAGRATGKLVVTPP